MALAVALLCVVKISAWIYIPPKRLDPLTTRDRLVSLFFFQSIFFAPFLDGPQDLPGKIKIFARSLFKNMPACIRHSFIVMASLGLIEFLLVDLKHKHRLDPHIPETFLDVIFFVFSVLVCLYCPLYTLWKTEKEGIFVEKR